MINITVISVSEPLDVYIHIKSIPINLIEHSIEDLLFDPLFMSVFARITPSPKTFPFKDSLK